jgi:tRNA pseudouridine55 synthase
MDVMGFLVVDKPEGITSYDVIRRLKPLVPRKTKIGHSGTLDPFATGLMIIAIGQAYTKQLGALTALDKHYNARIALGVTTDSYDCDGAVVAQWPDPIALSPERFREALAAFTGTITQAPPIFSAKKVNGKPAYALARKGQVVELATQSVTLHRIDLVDYATDWLDIGVHCSKGTYIRTLAHDIGAYLGVGGHLSRLQRVGIGGLSLDQAVALADISADTLSQYVVPTLTI